VRRIRLLLAAIVVIAAAVVVFLVLPRGQTIACGCGPPYQTGADDWVLPSLSGNGDVVKLAQFRGHPLVATFFASWCTACRDELPDFVGLSQRLPEVWFAGIDSEEYGDGAQFAQSLGITAWPLARDVGGSDADGLHEALTQEPGMPITAIYSASGTLLNVRIGAETSAQLAAALHQYVGVTGS
jgi:thiol-disulfide isomerase/thioredoxin